MNDKLQKLKQVLDQTIKLSHEQQPIYMGSAPQLISVLQAVFAVIEEQDARIKALEQPPGS
jgi:hypothetical protein